MTKEEEEDEEIADTTEGRRLPLFYTRNLLSQILDTTSKTSSSICSRVSIIIGLLHFLGCLCTNNGFAFGSASVVQIIKLLEPIETLILTVIFTKSFKTVTKRKVLSMLITISGTAILLLQMKKTKMSTNSTNHSTTSTSKPINLKSFFFAFCSGLCMASRNVTQKHCRRHTSKQKINNNNNSQTIRWNEAALTGIQNFIQITLYASAPALICAFATHMIYSSHHTYNTHHGELKLDEPSTTSVRLSPISLIQSSKWIGVESIVFHGLYNIASISVLSLVTAQSHSLLNVAKRISNILFVALVFNEKIGVNGWIGLIIAAIGHWRLFLYSMKSDST